MTAAPLRFRYQLELSGGEGRLAVQKICNQAFKIFARVNLIEFTRLDQREHDRSRPGTAFGVSAVPGFSANDMASQVSLLRVVVDRNLGVGQKQDQALEVIQKIAHCLGYFAVLRIFVDILARTISHGNKPGPHLLSQKQDLIRGLAFGISLKLVNLMIMIKEKFRGFRKRPASFGVVPARMRIIQR